MKQSSKTFLGKVFALIETVEKDLQLEKNKRRQEFEDGDLISIQNRILAEVLMHGRYFETFYAPDWTKFAPLTLQDMENILAEELAGFVIQRQENSSDYYFKITFPSYVE